MDAKTDGGWMANGGSIRKEVSKWTGRKYLKHWLLDLSYKDFLRFNHRELWHMREEKMGDK